jgi:hypothetical protein
MTTVSNKSLVSIILTLNYFAKSARLFNKIWKLVHSVCVHNFLYFASMESTMPRRLTQWYQLTLSSTVRLGYMWPGFFECIQLKNLWSTKILKKLYAWRSVLYNFWFQDSPPTMMPLDIFCKEYQKSDNPGHMRPRPWNSYHPREEKLDLPCHGPPSSDLGHAALHNSILCAQGGGGECPW